MGVDGGCPAQVSVDEFKKEGDDEGVGGVLVASEQNG